MNAQPQEIEGNPEAAICKRRLDELVGENYSVSGAIVSTVDGFEVASSVQATLAPAKMAAMTGSLLALALAICEESGVGRYNDLVIDAGSGRILLMDIPLSGRSLVLGVICNNNEETLGGVLWAARNTRTVIREEIASMN